MKLIHPATTFRLYVTQLVIHGFNISPAHGDRGNRERPHLNPVP